MQIIDQLIEKLKQHHELKSTSSFAAFATEVLTHFVGPELTVVVCRDYYRNKFQTDQATHTDFSDEAWTLYSDHQFMIELYAWVGRDTGIHDHSFEGAFCFLEGEGEQIVFDYTPMSETSVGIITHGQLAFVKQDQLSAGQVRSIFPGTQLIHQVLHSPHSYTLCVRTHEPPGSHLHSYLYPHLRVERHRLSEGDEKIWKSFTTSQQWHERLNDTDFDSHFFLRWAQGHRSESFEHERCHKWGSEKVLEAAVAQHRNFMKQLMVFKNIK